MGFVIRFTVGSLVYPVYFTDFVKKGDSFLPIGVPRTRRGEASRFPFRIAWFIVQNMRRVGYQAEVQYVK